MSKPPPFQAVRSAVRARTIFEPMTELLEEHLKTLAQYPPVQGGTSFDQSNVVGDFLEKARMATAQRSGTAQTRAIPREEHPVVTSRQPRWLGGGYRSRRQIRRSASRVQGGWRGL